MRSTGRDAHRPKRVGDLSIAFAGPMLGLAILIAAVGGCGRENAAGPYDALFPDPRDVAGVTGAGQVTEYRDETMYDFLDGGAELYFDYDIAAVASREYMLPEDSEVEVSIYDMGEPSNAFGIYSIFRYVGAATADIGNEAMVSPASLDFWKGKYYCKLFAFGSSDLAEEALATLARTVAGRITDVGDQPELLDLLPGDGRLAGSEKYFRRHLALNNIRYVASENMLDLGNGTEGVTAQYRAEDAEYTGYIIRYPGVSQAEAAFRRYSDFLAKSADETSLNDIEVFIVGEVPKEAIALVGSHIVGVWDVGGEGLGFIRAVRASLSGEE